jgi:Arc/MetJ family transcription regulator
MDILGAVTKRLIDVDDKKVAKAKKLLGASTLKATVDGALDELIALDARRRSLLALRDESGELADDAKRRAAWG